MLSRAVQIAALLCLSLSIAGCGKKEQAKAPEVRPVRTTVVEPKPIDDDRQAVGEIRPRYETDMSFRVAGKIRERLVDVGATVKKGDALARLDEQDYQNRLRSAEADVTAAEAGLVEAQGAEARQGKLLKDGYTPRSTYDTTLRNLRSAEAKLTSSRAALDLTKDQLKYTELKADFDGVVTAVAAEAGQNVAAGQMVVRVAQPGDKDAVFNIAESAFRDKTKGVGLEVEVWPLSDPALLIDGNVREVSPVADPATRTYQVKVTLKSPPPTLRLGMSVAGRVKTSTAPVVVLPMAALTDKDKAPAVWLVTPASESATAPAASAPTAKTAAPAAAPAPKPSVMTGMGGMAGMTGMAGEAPATHTAGGIGTVSRRLVTVSRYETDKVVIADGLAKGDVVVTAGVNMLREGQKVRLLEGGAAK